VEASDLSLIYYEEPGKAEFIDGVEYAMGAGSIKHAEIITNLMKILHASFDQKACIPYTSELEICLDESTFRPDISIICDFTKAMGNVYKGAPTLVIEVLSPSTAYMDYGKKFNYYQRHGVKEYWIINPDYQTIEQYALEDRKYKLLAVFLNTSIHEFNPDNPHVYTTSFQSFVFKDLYINLDEVFHFRMG